MKKVFQGFALLLILCFTQKSIGQSLLQVNPISAEGLPIEKIEVYVIEDDSTYIIKGKEYKDFLSYFHLQENGFFNQSVHDLKAKKMLELEEVFHVEYKTYTAQLSGPVVVKWLIDTKPGAAISADEGFLKTGKIKNIPLLLETDNSKILLFLNGGAGVFVDNNAFFGEGESFTIGNPVADNPANGGIRGWSEFFLEPGIGGITGIGKADVYIYGAISGLFSARIGTDIYTEGSTAFMDIERAYAGFLFARLGKNQNMKLDISAGRNFFQLNDGFLFSKYSGSSNAGERGSVYLNSRTTFQKTVLITFTAKHWTINSFFIEPQELFPDRQTNINYTGLTAGYNNNKSIDVNVSFIHRTGGLGTYTLPNGESIDKKGLWIANPKLWISNIMETGMFIKSEYALETKSGMLAHAWYAGIGIKRENWKFEPTLYYRYAFMEGDDPTTSTYERFDPLLTGGLANWVQGLNYRKVLGNGNIISHRLELSGYLTEKVRLSVDAFFLKADVLNNQGGLEPIAQLQSKNFGQEYTLTAQYFISTKFLLLGVFSTGFPGNAITDNLPDAKSWQTFQLSIFTFL